MFNPDQVFWKSAKLKQNNLETISKNAKHLWCNDPRDMKQSSRSQDKEQYLLEMDHYQTAKTNTIK